MSNVNTEANENEESNFNVEDFSMIKKYQHTLYIFIPTALLAYITYLFSTEVTPTLGESLALLLSTMLMFGVTSFILKDYYWRVFVANNKVASQHSEQVEGWKSLYETEEMNVIFDNLDEEGKEKLASYSISLDNARNAFSLMRFARNSMFPLAALTILQFYNLLLIVQ